MFKSPMPTSIHNFKSIFQFLTPKWNVFISKSILNYEVRFSHATFVNFRGHTKKQTAPFDFWDKTDPDAYLFGWDLSVWKFGILWPHLDLTFTIASKKWLRTIERMPLLTSMVKIALKLVSHYSNVTLDYRDLLWPDIDLGLSLVL